MNTYNNTPDMEEHPRIQLRMERLKRVRRLKILICCAAVVFLGCIAFLTVHAYTKPVLITLKFNNMEISQGEQLPEFKAKAIYHGKNKDKILDKAGGLTVGKLLKELNSGEDYTFSHKIDTNVDKEYPVKIVLNKDFQIRLKKKFRSKVELNVQNGTLTVKNNLGMWEGNKFKLNDGNYMTNAFLTSEGNTYYFDENGDPVTGQRQIGLKNCTFSDKGVLISKDDAVISPTKPMIALTFDDGPGQRTEELLRMLDQYNAHATFFMQGMNVGKYPDAIKKMVETGNELGNHSYNHPELTKLAPAKIKIQIQDTNDTLNAICGQGATVLRPPYGSIDDKVSQNVGMPMVLWTVDTLDWKTKDAKATTEAILSNASDGAVVLLHDIHDFSVDGAIAAIPELTRQGYQLVTISELAAAKGINLEAGQVYREFSK